MAQKTFTPGSKGIQSQYITRLAVGLLALLFLSSCTLGKRTTAVNGSQSCQVEIEKKDTVVNDSRNCQVCDSKIRQLEKENAELTSKLAEQKLLSKKLQQTLLMRHKETDTCWQANEKLIKELSQSKAKLATPGSKLEAATLIAEATAVISTVEQKPLNELQKIVRKRALKKLNESQQELAEGNYESASYLSREAMEQAKGIDISEDSSTADPVEKQFFFSTPLEMKLFTTGNLREGPSIKAEVKKVLQEGRRVIAVGYKQNWVKVKLADTDETGWIHLSLLY
ncbi:SH3 domain-containing protein [uncultured Desulfobacter sp.]|uniref:SH3 domain-containing protein n=1 Tax=uncultured Desulfobacter sp. TaxID=240139 RepID=UPI002AABB210|nr:SH3 domain-containing protein [uncultured Desulfobacter sp.]